MEVVGGRKDYKIDCIAEEFKIGMLVGNLKND